MTTATITETKAHLSKMLADIELNGKEIVIRRGKKPIAKIIPLTSRQTKKRKLGICKDKIWIAEDFDAEEKEINALFSGEA